MNERKKINDSARPAAACGAGHVPEYVTCACPMSSCPTDGRTDGNLLNDHAPDPATSQPGAARLTPRSVTTPPFTATNVNNSKCKLKRNVRRTRSACYYTSRRPSKCHTFWRQTHALVVHLNALTTAARNNAVGQGRK